MAETPPPVSSKEGGRPKMFPIFAKHYQPKENIKSVHQLQLEMEKANSRKRKRTMLTKETNGLVQSVLDAGQKQIGPKFCEECGLLYSPGDFVDEEEHRKAHIRIENTFQLTLWKDARILFHYPDGCQIIMVQADLDAGKVKNRLRDFLAWLDSELGAGYDPSGIRKTERIFLYTARTTRKNVVRILGCGIMELPNASKILTSTLVNNNERLSSSSQDSLNSESASSSTVSSQNSELSMSQHDNEIQNHSKIHIGITRLWTDSGFRRRNIATKICEMMRFNSGILGFIVPHENFGILEPSETGRSFMAKYTNFKGAAYTYK